VFLTAGTWAAAQGPGKKWEHYELNKNGKPLRIPMHVRKGDTVQIITGKDKGKVGEVSLVRSGMAAMNC
jgi:large subunit ribosomal protein L24